MGDFVFTDQFICKTHGRLPSGYGQESQDHCFQGGTIYNDAASGLIWVENQIYLGANETVMGKARFEQWLWDQCITKVKHYHGDNGIFSAEEYCCDCTEKGQTQSFPGVGAQHQNACAERAIQTIMYIAQTFMVHAALHWTDHGSDDLSCYKPYYGTWDMCTKARYKDQCVQGTWIPIYVQDSRECTCCH